MLKDRQDIELTNADIQQLSNRDALTAFFARLGYDTNHRLVQNLAAMDITSDALKNTITHIERLASEDRYFEIYLFELKSVTVSTTNALVRSFRNRSGDYLLVLTQDYERLDFVLVQRYNTAQAQTPETLDALSLAISSAPVQVSVRPRVLSVNRRKPAQVDLRVLRRFSYTESDIYAQYDKLTSAYDIAAWSEPFFNNRALFSDYYLTERLPQHSVWDNPTDSIALTRAFKTLRALYDGVRDTYNNQPAAFVQSHLIEPALMALGFTLQPVQSTRNGTIEHTYMLAASQAPSTPVALCLAYFWNRSLDGKDDRDTQSPDENPGASVVTLLERGDAPWAIVTNGKTWRLYSAKAHSRATNYYEIDLEETLAMPPANLEYAFRYFWLLFRAAAFVPQLPDTDGPDTHTPATQGPATQGPATQGPDTHKGYHYISQRDDAQNVVTPLVGVRLGGVRRVGVRHGDNTPCFLDTLLAESERYARELGERLKDRVFEDIFPHFARGFILHARQHNQLPANLEDLDAAERNTLLEPYFSGTLTFLYRLLFLLYAESRDLLPVRELHGYFPHSLEQLKRQIAHHAGTIQDEAAAKLETAYHDLSTRLYDGLQTLFQAVDKGDAALNVPVYNGGLFVTSPDPADLSPEAAVARFLAAHKIPDRHLALGLDLMARDRDEKRHDLVFIDYKSLGVRQLGSIYEGLLEFKLRVAPEEMVIIKGKKAEEVIPISEARQKNLLNERRGKDARLNTYPKGRVYLENDRRERKASGSYYTPDYIVKYIVQHTVGPILAEKFESLRPLFREAQQTLRVERDKAKALPRLNADPELETYKKYRDTLNEAFFDLKVLDPAMGSGHFLVEAVDYITDQMATFLTAFRWNPVVYALSRTRHEIQQEMERQAITIDSSKLTDINLLKRQVLKRCIYGVDLNPMAVELAKVSLWLDCFTLGAPLSFLDHHMKPGNSLIGGRIDEARNIIEQGQLSFFGSNLWAGALLATKSMIEVGRLSDVTADQVRESKQHYQAAAAYLAPFKRILDIYVSRWFGNEPGKSKQGKAAIDKALDFLRSTESQEWYQHPNRIERLNDEQRTVVSLALQAAKEHSFFHWELEFPEVFFAPAPGTSQAIQPKANPGFDAVVGNPPYRVLIKSQVGSALLIYYNSTYASAQYNPNLFALMIECAIKVSNLGGLISFIVPSLWLTNTYFSQLRHVMVFNTQLFQLIDLGFGVFDEVVETSIFILKRRQEKESYRAVLAAKVSNVQQIDILPKTVSSEMIVEDIETGFAFFNEKSNFEAFLSRSSQALGKSFIVYRGVETKDNGRYLSKQTLSPDYKPILLGTDMDRYECEWTGTYVKFVPAELKSNADISMYNVPEKVLLRRTGSQLIAAFDAQQLLAIKNLYVIIPKQNLSGRFLLSLLNSKLLNQYNQAALGNAGDAFAQLKKTDVEALPIRRITFTLTPDQRATYLDNAKNLYASYLTDHDQQPMLAFVDHHLTQQPEQSDVVHDLLAYLAEEMIRLNKEKRASMQQFLTSLQSTLHILPDRDGRAGIDVLTGKSKLLDFPGDYQKGEPPLPTAELEDILQKNKNKLGISLNDSALLARVKRDYESSLERILPLKEQLARTDRLIDAVVYRLYGLTEEEIAVVEGKK